MAHVHFDFLTDLDVEEFEQIYADAYRYLLRSSLAGERRYLEGLTTLTAFQRRRLAELRAIGGTPLLPAQPA